jgi:hypothetical protein
MVWGEGEEDFCYYFSEYLHICIEFIVCFINYLEVAIIFS